MRKLLVIMLLALPVDKLLAQTTQPTSSKDVTGIVESLRKNTVDLRRASWAPPAGEEHVGDLKQSVDQVKAMNTPTAMQLSGRTPEAGTKPLAQTAPVSQEAAAQSQPTTSTKNLISPETLELLKRNPPGDFRELLVVADALFGSNEITDAAIFYELALQQGPTGDDKGWILFQLANCRRESDPDAARVFIKRLSAEAPNCPWANLANAVDRVIEWEMTEKPQALLKKPTTMTATAPTTSPMPASRPTTSKPTTNIVKGAE